MPPAAGRKHRTSHLQTVPATVPAIAELAAELLAAGVQMVPVEATSDYWRIWFAGMEEAGLAVQLVSSSQARNLPGRPKTDKEDARRVARLTEMGCCGPRSCRRRRSGRCGPVPGTSGT
jgi:transposase